MTVLIFLSALHTPNSSLSLTSSPAHGKQESIISSGLCQGQLGAGPVTPPQKTPSPGAGVGSQGDADGPRLPSEGPAPRRTVPGSGHRRRGSRPAPPEPPPRPRPQPLAQRRGVLTRREAVGSRRPGGPAATAAAPPPPAGALTLPCPRSPSRSRRGGDSHPGVGPGSPGRLQPLGTRLPRSPTPDPPPTPTPATRHLRPTPRLPPRERAAPGARASLPARPRVQRRGLPEPPTPDPESGFPRACAARETRGCLWKTPLLRVFGAVEGGGEPANGREGARPEPVEGEETSPRFGKRLQ
nr:basic proline-rich protein-like [Globicephala melas]